MWYLLPTILNLARWLFKTLLLGKLSIISNEVFHPAFSTIRLKTEAPSKEVLNSLQKEKFYYLSSHYLNIG